MAPHRRLPVSTFTQSKRSRRTIHDPVPEDGTFRLDILLQRDADESVLERAWILLGSNVSEKIGHGSEISSLDLSNGLVNHTE